MHASVLNRLRRIAAAAVAGFAVWLASAPGARADVTIKISFDFVETRVSPRLETYSARLSESYKIAADKTVDATRSAGGSPKRAKLGDQATGVNEGGQTSTSKYQIVNGAVVITTHNPGFFHVLKIITDGRTSCSATKTYYRNPGHQYFEALTPSGEEILATDFQAQNMTCSIAE